MKKAKRLLSLLLALACLFSMVPTAALAAEEISAEPVAAEVEIPEEAGILIAPDEAEPEEEAAEEDAQDVAPEEAPELVTEEEVTEDAPEPTEEATEEATQPVNDENVEDDPSEQEEFANDSAMNWSDSYKGTIYEGSSNLYVDYYERVIYSFYPEKSGTYVFSSNCSEGTFGLFFNSDGSVLAFDDDSNGNENFKLKAKLQAGTQYYIGVGFDDQYYTRGYIPVVLKRQNGQSLDLSKAKVTISKKTFDFNGGAQKPNPTVKLNGKTLKKGTDYKVTYKNNVNAGTATLTVTGINGNKGSKSIKFTIKPVSISKVKVSFKTVRYTGQRLKPKPIVKIGNNTLKLGVHYTISSYSNNLKPGTGKIVIKGKGSLKGTLTKTFKIQKGDAGLKFAQSSVTKQATSPSFTNKLSKKTDGKISYKSSNTKVATVNSKTGKVTIKGKGSAVITATSTETKLYAAGKATFKLQVGKSSKPGKFKWNNDNLNFTNSSYNFPGNTYADQISDSYVKRLKKNLNNIEYQWIFDSRDGMIYQQWGGSCYGMAVLELLAKEGMNIKYSDYQSGAKCLYDFRAPVNNMKVSSLVTYYFLLQFKQKLQNEYGKALDTPDSTLIKQLVKNLNSHSTCLFCFKMSIGGHAILATGVEYGNFYKCGKTYDGHIFICDPNFSLGHDEDADIYFDRSSYEWTIPVYDEYLGSRGKIMIISSDKNLLNTGGFLTSSNSAMEYVARLNTLTINDNHSVSKVRLVNNTIEGVKSSGDDIVREDAVIFGGAGSGSTPGYNLYDSASGYQVSQKKAGGMKLNLCYQNCYLEAEADAGQTAVFDQSGLVQVSGNASKCSLRMTFNEGYPTDWPTVGVSSDKASEMALKTGAEGYIVSGSSLKNVTVTVSNRGDDTTQTFSTDASQALICQDGNGALDIRIDADNNGTFETSVLGK